MHDMLEQVSRRLSFHMPASQGCAPFECWDPYSLDTTELPVTDDLYRPEGAIAKAQSLAAQSAGAACTLMLHGGGTAGMHTMLLYVARRGETVIMPRNIHVSALNGCAFMGIEPAFAELSFTALGRPYTAVSAHERAMRLHPDAKAAVVSRPDYYGLASDLAEIARLARGHGMMTLCDEAHGAALNWRTDIPNAGACGADLFFQSAHKTLPALTAGAWLHGGARVDGGRLLRCLRMIQTSSPSFLSLLSLDDARAWMDKFGAQACTALAESVSHFYHQVELMGYCNGQTDAPEGFVYDPLRIVLLAPEGGEVLAEDLSSQGIDVEMCDSNGIVCIVSLLDGPARLGQLKEALSRVKRCRGGRVAVKSNRSQKLYPPMPERALSVEQAVFAKSVPIPLKAAAGMISAAHVGLYPPGTALCVAGERFSRDMIGYLERLDGRRLFGLPAPGRLLCVAES